MNLHAAQTEISTLEDVLSRAAPGDSLLAVKVALAWHLRQRDSARTLRLVDEVMTLVGASGPRAQADVDGDGFAACRARAALAAGEASALHCDFDAAERWLLDARIHPASRWDAQAGGDAWLLEACIAKARGQRKRELKALDGGIAYFEISGAPERLAIARMWLAFERTLAQPDLRALAQLEPPGKAWPDACVAWDAIWSAARALALSHRDPGTAAALYEHASLQARAVGMVQLDVVCTLDAGAAMHDLGDYDLAARYFDLAARRACATGWPTLVGASDTRVGELLRDLGAFDDSRRILSDSIDTLASTSRGTPLARASAALAQTLLAMGLVEESLAPIGAAIDLHRDAGSGPDLASTLILQARALSAAGLPQRALTVLDEATSLIDDLGLHSLRIGLTEVLADLHHRFPLPPPPGMTLATAALHYAEATLTEGSRIDGWKAGAALYAFLADRWAEAGDHARAYDHARHALSSREQQTTQKMSYPLALLRARQRAADDPAAASIAAAQDRERRERR